MTTIYHRQDDILELRLSDKHSERELSQNWNVNVSYAEDGSVVELVMLDAVKKRAGTRGLSLKSAWLSKATLVPTRS